MPMNVFHEFFECCEPLMLNTASDCLCSGQLPQECLLRLINCIPKFAGPLTIRKLRPIALVCCGGVQICPCLKAQH